MQFSNTTTKDGLIQNFETATDLGDGNVSSSPVLLAQVLSKINQAYNLVIAWILDSQSQWEFDDSNYTDFPIGLSNLVDQQQDYSLPGATTTSFFTTFLRLLRVEALNAGGQYIELKAFDEREIDGIALSEFNKTPGMPVYFREVGSSIEVYPKPAAANVTLAAGLRVYFQRTPSLFLITDTTKEPGIPLPFHPLVYMLAAASYLKDKKVFDLMKEVNKDIYGDPEFPNKPGQKAVMENYYASRSQVDKPRMLPRSRRTNYE